MKTTTTTSESGPARDPAPHLFRRPRWFFFLGVIWPTGTIIFELLTRACASGIFDPLPTVWHVLLAATVPAANALVWWIGGGPPSRYTRWGSALRGAAWVSGSIYLAAFGAMSLLAIVSLPFSLVLLSTGLSALLAPVTLGPLMGWLMLVRSAFKLNQVRAMIRREGVSLVPISRMAWGGAAFAVTIWITAEYGMVRMVQMLESANFADRTHLLSTVTDMRRSGREEMLRNLCFGNTARPEMISPLNWLIHGGGAHTSGIEGVPLNLQALRELYYRAYGQTFESQPPTRRSRGIVPVESSFVGVRGRDTTSGFAWDDQRGGDAIGARLRGLSMQSSRLDWHVDEPSRLAYGEWTLEFNNRHTNAQEARCQMLLPPGAVVSRLTLWINGDEREAAFAGKAKIKAAYQQVVTVDRRDPVMVNMVGPDCVMTQCFPVPPGGLMKIRLGITTPLDGESAGHLLMPRIIERNFTISPQLMHTLWVQCASAFDLSNGEKAAPQIGGVVAWQGRIAEDVFPSLQATFPMMTKSPGPRVWTQDPFTTGPDKYLVRETTIATSPAADELIVVVDTSRSLVAWSDEIKQCLAAAPDRVSKILFTTDDGFKEAAPQDLDAIWSQPMFVGGVDNGPALQRAASLALSSGGKAQIVWLHGPQPFEFPGLAGLEQVLERAVNPPVIHAIALERGVNRLLEKLYRHASVVSVGKRFAIDETNPLQPLWSSIGSTPKTLHTYQRQSTPPSGDAATQVWDHLARYEAFETVLRQFKGTQKADPVSAALAARYQLVTPVSGAVVLETRQQYDRAGLTPVDPKSTPQIPNGSVPEPSTTALLCLGLSAAMLLRRRSQPLAA